MWYTKLKLLRKNAQMTQEQVALKIGVSKQTISGYERGEVEPTFETLLKLCNVYGVTPNDLFNINEKEASMFDVDLDNAKEKEIKVVYTVIYHINTMLNSVLKNYEIDQQYEVCEILIAILDTIIKYLDTDTTKKSDPWKFVYSLNSEITKTLNKRNSVLFDCVISTLHNYLHNLRD